MPCQFRKKCQERCSAGQYSEGVLARVQSRTKEKYRKTLLPLLVHIEEHLDEDLSLKALAALAGFSPHHFHRVFQHVTGETPKEYVRRLRLERAVYRLKVSPDNVLDIALEAGFQTHESFTRAFTQHFAMSPSDLRNSLRTYRACIDETLGTYTFAGFSLESPVQLRQDNHHEPISIEQTAPRQLIFRRCTGPYEALLAENEEFAELWAPLFAFAEAQGLAVDETELIGICHDDPYVADPEKVRFDACLAVAEPVRASHPIGSRILQGGLNVVRRHAAGFEEIAKTFAFIGVEWLPTEDYLLRAAPPFEVYRCQRIQGRLERLYTDSYVPLEPVKAPL